MTARVAVLVAAALWLVPVRGAAQEVHLVLVTGLGGAPEYSETFHDWSSTLRTGALEAGVRPERIAWLAEDPARAPDAITARSTRENLESVLADLADAAGRDDRILLVFIGHGTARGDEARFNLPGPDISGADLVPLLDRFGGRSVAVVNAAPASGPWVERLADPERVVITATRTARERNETTFGRYFAAAFAGDGADLDKDDRVSLAEAFRFAVREVERHYEEENLLLTEHAVLGDEGGVAERFWLTPRLGVRAGAPGAAVPEGVDDPALRALYRERAALEAEVAALRARKGEMETEEYESRLEDLLVELALKNRAIREAGGGGR